MNILYDAQVFSQNHGGISRYFCELFTHFKSTGEVACNLPIEYSNNHYLHSLGIVPGLKALNEPSEVGTNVRLSIQHLTAAQFDIFHPTYYDPYFFEYIGTKPYVVTVYDMIHEIFVEYFQLDDPTRLNKKNLVRNASGIIAISQSTKKDLVDIFDIDEKLIEVIHLASPFPRQKPGGPHPVVNGPRNYLLYVGGRWGYKNFYFFLESVAPILLNTKDLYLVCAGGGPFTKDEFAFARKLEVSQRIYQCDIEDALLPSLYGNAAAFVFPSLYEGFGLPVLEAFSCGCPAVLSATSSLPEVAGNAAEYFDPKDMKSLQNAVIKVLSDPNLRSTLISGGFDRVEKFSWKNTAEQTKLLYQQVCRRAPRGSI